MEEEKKDSAEYDDVVVMMVHIYFILFIYYGFIVELEMAGSETCMLGHGSSLDVTGSWPEIGVSGNYNRCQIQNFFDTIHTVLRPHDLSYPSEST